RGPADRFRTRIPQYPRNTSATDKMLNRREFLQILATASAAGMSLPAFASSDAKGGALYDIPKFGNVSLLHFTDCHAQLMPIYFREPSVNIGLGDARGRAPHLVGEH